MKKNTVLKAFVALALGLGAVSPGFGQLQQNLLTGSFFMFDRNLSTNEMVEEIAQMGGLGITNIVVLSVGQLDGTPGTPGGPCTSLASTIYPSAYAHAQPASDQVQTMLSWADLFGMKVYFGSLQTLNDWTTGMEFSALESCNNAVAQELYQNYGTHPSFVGYYFTQEIWLNWVKYYGSTYYGISIPQQFVSNVAAVAPGKIVMAAPIFKEQPSGSMPGLTATEAGLWLGQFLFGSNLKLVAPQDGQGAQAGAPTLPELPAYYAAMQVAAQANSAALWSTLETFYNDGSGANTYPPAPISRITQQIAAEAPYVSGMIEWMFGHDMSEEATYYPILASQLQADYKTWLWGASEPWLWGASEPIKLPYSYVYGSPFNPSGIPSASYPDYSLTKLNDGAGGGFNLAGVNNTATDWVGFDNLLDGGLGYVTINLGQIRTVQKIRILARSETSSGIYFPQYYAFNFSEGPDLTGTQTIPMPGPSDGDYLLDSPQFSVYWMDLAFGAQAQYITICVSHAEWGMISEIEIYGH